MRGRGMQWRERGIEGGKMEWGREEVIKKREWRVKEEENVWREKVDGKGGGEKEEGKRGR